MDDAAYSQALAAASQGKWAEVQRICRTILSRPPLHLGASILLGEALVATGRSDAALQFYQVVVDHLPNDARAVTRLSTIIFRQHFGQSPPRPPAPADVPRLQMTTLGNNGRFGNQILQYGFLRLYAREHGLLTETSDWIGRDLFDCDDPLPSRQLPLLKEKHTIFFASLNRRIPAVYANCDIMGWFAAHTRDWGGRCHKFRAQYRPGFRVKPLVGRALERLREAGNTLVAIHLRFGDFGFGRFWVAPPEWYRDWLESAWPALDRPLLYVATDHPAVMQEFAAFSPWDSTRLGITIPGAEFYLDHYILSQADHLAVANSSFSRTAAMLNERAASFARPHPDQRRLVPFDPWDSPDSLQPQRSETFAQDEKDILLRYFREGECVVHLGRFCSEWTNEARAFDHSFRIIEAAPSVSVDRLRNERNLARIHHLVIENARDFAAVIEGARTAMAEARIDAVHLCVKDGDDVSFDETAFSGLGYRIFRYNKGAFERPEKPSLPPGRYLVIRDPALPAGTKR